MSPLHLSHKGGMSMNGECNRPTIPIASQDTLGAVMIGRGVTLHEDGTISVDRGDSITESEFEEMLNRAIE